MRRSQTGDAGRRVGGVCEAWHTTPGVEVWHQVWTCWLDDDTVRQQQTADMAPTAVLLYTQYTSGLTDNHQDGCSSVANRGGCPLAVFKEGNVTWQVCN